MDEISLGLCFAGCFCDRCMRREEPIYEECIAVQWVGPRVEVTAEMRVAGAVAANEVCLSLFMAKWNSSDAEKIACAAYRAMHAAAPVPLVSEAEDLRRDRDKWKAAARRFQAELLPYAQASGCPAGTQIDKWAVAKAREADNLRAEVTSLHDALKVRTDERDKALSDVDEMALRFTHWRQLAGRQDREIQRLRAMLPAEPEKPALNVVTRTDDPRRMGWGKHVDAVT